MKTFVIASLFAVTTAVSSVAVAAPDENANRNYHERYVERMTSELKLTPAQQEQMLELHMKHAEKMQVLRDEQHKEVDTILNAEQREQLKTMLENRRNKYMQHRSERDSMRKQHRSDRGDKQMEHRRNRMDGDRNPSNNKPSDN